MAREDFQVYAKYGIGLVGGYMLYRVALTGGLGAGAQDAALSICTAFKGRDACLADIFRVGGTPPKLAAPVPPPGGAKPCDTTFSASQYVGAYGAGWIVVVGGRQVGPVYTDLNAAQNAYNTEVCK